jgi:hypothetical protein
MLLISSGCASSRIASNLHSVLLSSAVDSAAAAGFFSNSVLAVVRAAFAAVFSFSSTVAEADSVKDSAVLSLV